jgi:hypothetical protein
MMGHPNRFFLRYLGAVAFLGAALPSEGIDLTATRASGNSGRSSLAPTSVGSTSGIPPTSRRSAPAVRQRVIGTCKERGSSAARGSRAAGKGVNEGWRLRSHESGAAILTVAAVLPLPDIPPGERLRR